MSGFSIRPAVPGDEGTIETLLRAFATYVDRLFDYHTDAATIARDLFGEAPRASAALALVDGAPAGVAVWYFTYATFSAQRGLYIEDIFVLPQYRRQGLGKAFWAYMAGEALREGATRMEWLVLDWNEKAKAFYLSLGGKQAAEWQSFHLEGDAMRKLAQ